MGRWKEPCCPMCGHPEFTVTPPIEGETIKPYFKCTNCGNGWTSGRDGKPYISSKFALQKEK